MYPPERFPAVLKHFGLFEHNLIDYGSWRSVYDMGDMVLKLPRNREGLTEQLIEYALYTENLQFLRGCPKIYTRTGFRYFYSYHKVMGLSLPLNPCEIDLVEGLPVLLAPKLIPVWNLSEGHSTPWWDYLTDGYQVGVVRVGAPALLYDYNAWFHAYLHGFLEALEIAHPDNFRKIWEQMQQYMELVLL